MDNQEMDEASIDLETLQAQIDMSMSFAQEMVSSWVKPSRKLPSKSSRDIEAELKEYMHRPPRLGVGAAIPEAHASSRETARLRGQLLGKGNKRSREDERETKEKSEDEEESRAGIIKKKARVDPFGGNDGKKKKKKKSKMAPESSAVAPNPLPLPETEAEEQEEVISMVTEDIGEPSTPTATPKRKKRKKKHSTLEPSVDAAVATESVPAPMSPPGTNVPDDSSKSSQEITAGPLNTPKKIVDVSLTSTPATPLHARRQAQSAALLKQPLLNLAPPGSDDESEEDANVDTPGASSKQKKKRKRRKKKKHAENGLKLETQTEHVADVV